MATPTSAFYAPGTIVKDRSEGWTYRVFSVYNPTKQTPSLAYWLCRSRRFYRLDADRVVPADDANRDLATEVESCIQRIEDRGYEPHAKHLRLMREELIKEFGASFDSRFERFAAACQAIVDAFDRGTC